MGVSLQTGGGWLFPHCGCQQAHVPRQPGAECLLAGKLSIFLIPLTDRKLNLVRCETKNKFDRQELRRQARTVQLGQMRGTGENMDGSAEFQSTEAAEEARDQSYPLTIGMGRATERRTKL